MDQRFNHRQYDTANTVEAFGVRLCDQIDLHTLSDELLRVVNQIMERCCCGRDHGLIRRLRGGGCAG